MRLAHVACALTCLLLAACESPQRITSDAGGDGSVTGAADSGAVASEPLDGVVEGRTLTSPAGSAGDFVANVGDRVQFGFDRYDLSDEARLIVENQAIWLSRFPGVSVTVEGHADERGTREYNLALGERRANSVRDYMIALGIEPNRVRTVSYGKERPVDPASNEAAWTANRRAVTVVEGGAT